MLIELSSMIYVSIFFQYPFFFHVPISAQPFLSSIQINSWLDSPILVLVKLGSDSVSQGNRYILLVSAPWDTITITQLLEVE